MYHGNTTQGSFDGQSPHHSRYPSQPELMSHQQSALHYQQSTSHGNQYTSPHAQQHAFSPTMPPPADSTGQHYIPPPRGVLGSSHSHSKSSPMAALDPKYMPFSQSTPAATPSSSKMFTSQTPTSATFSPLGLADIIPNMKSESGYEDEAPAAYDDNVMSTNSNHMAPWPTYAYDWCKWPVTSGNSCGKMALGSFLEDPHNFIQILDSELTPQSGGPGGSSYNLEFTKVAEAACAYPVTRISWEPPSSQKQSTDLLATSGDHLRLWSLPNNQQNNVTSNINRSSAANTRDQPVQKLLPLALLSNSKTPEHTAPLTSLDWNTLSPKLIITSSIDTTCTIWDIPTLTAKTQLIAHDREVFDVRFCAGSVDVFASCGADGSVRMFDLRSLEHSTIIYEPAEKNDKDAKSSPLPPSPTKGSGMTMTPAPPLLRLAASPHDAHLLATFAADSNLIRILDVRQPGTAIIELQGHSANLNSIEWSPTRRSMLASGADDSLVLVWDLLNAATGPVAANGVTGAPTAGGVGGATPGQGNEAQNKAPAASWRCPFEVSNLSWAPQSVLTSQGGDWLGVCGGRGIWGVKL